MKRVIVVIEGGNVQRVLTDEEDTEVYIIDHDNDGVPDQELQNIHESGEIYKARVWQEGDYNPQTVDRIISQIAL